MPFKPPRLDDRSFEGLLTDLVRRIPAHAPEWTSFRVGDPGYTLLELFAWLGDTLLYRANLIPERQRLVFLKLLGIQQRSAVPARGLVGLGFRRPEASEVVTMKRGATVTGPVDFETHDEVNLLPITLQAFAKVELTSEQRKALGPLVGELEELYRNLLGGSGNDEPPARPYLTSAIFAEGARPRGFDLVAETVDRALWLALVAAPKADLATVTQTLLAGNGGRPWLLNVGVSPATLPVDPLAEIASRRPLSHVWEVLTPEVFGGRPTFRALDVVRDSTAGLTRDGVLRLSLSPGAFGVPSNDLAENPAAGVGPDAPPRVDDPELAERIVGWLRLRPTEALRTLPISWIASNAVEIEQTRSVGPVVAGRSSGQADQVISLPGQSIVPDSLVLQVEEGEAGYRTWQRVDDVTAFGRDARVFALDSDAGNVRFGNGVQGRAPAPGARIRVAEMRTGGGAAGNLPPRALEKIRGRHPNDAVIVDPIEVLQLLPTRGGTDPETLAQAEQRIPSLLRHRNRAVTSDDFRVLSSTVPGLPVGRVEILPRFKPQQRRSDVPGVVSVMVLPTSRSVTAEPPAPRPDRPFLETVHAWLDDRRAVGTELYVIGAEYVPVGISVGVDLREGAEIEATLSSVRRALRFLCWPLPPGGPRGVGWELGTTVASGQLEVAVARVAGVSAVRGVRLFARGNRDWSAAPRRDGVQHIELRKWQLPELLSVVALAGAEAPEDLRGAPNPFDPPGGGDERDAMFAIPVVREVC